MRRREFIGLIGTAALSFPRPGYAQTKTDIPVVGLLMPFKSDETLTKERVTALRKGLQEAGFIEGTNYSLAARFAEGDFNRLPQLARELVALNPRVIVVVGFGINAVRRPFPEQPLVFTGIAADPIALGLAQSYVHPGGMITGNVMNAVGGEETMTQKRIGLFKQLVPSLKRLGLIAPANGVLAVEEKQRYKKWPPSWTLKSSPTISILSTIWKAPLRRAFAMT